MSALSFPKLPGDIKDDDDNGFGSTVRYAPGVTKVRYRKEFQLKKKTKNGPKWKQKNPNKPGKNGGFGATVRYAPGVTKVRYRKKI